MMSGFDSLIRAAVQLAEFETHFFGSPDAMLGGMPSLAQYIRNDHCYASSPSTLTSSIDRTMNEQTDSSGLTLTDHGHSSEQNPTREPDDCGSSGGKLVGTEPKNDWKRGTGSIGSNAWLNRSIPLSQLNLNRTAPAGTVLETTIDQQSDFNGISPWLNRSAPVNPFGLSPFDSLEYRSIQPSSKQSHKTSNGPVPWLNRSAPPGQFDKMPIVPFEDTTPRLNRTTEFAYARPWLNSGNCFNTPGDQQDGLTTVPTRGHTMTSVAGLAQRKRKMLSGVLDAPSSKMNSTIQKSYSVKTLKENNNLPVTPVITQSSTAQGNPSLNRTAPVQLLQYSDVKKDFANASTGWSSLLGWRTNSTHATAYHTLHSTITLLFPVRTHLPTNGYEQQAATTSWT